MLDRNAGWTERRKRCPKSTPPKTEGFLTFAVKIRKNAQTIISRRARKIKERITVYRIVNNAQNIGISVASHMERKIPMHTIVRSHRLPIVFFSFHTNHFWVYSWFFRPGALESCLFTLADTIADTYISGLTFLRFANVIYILFKI